MQEGMLQGPRARLATLTTEVNSLEERAKDYLPPEVLPPSATFIPHTDPRPLLASPTTPSTPDTTVQGGPWSPFLRSNASVFDPRVGFQQTSSNGQPSQGSRLPGFLRNINTANGTSGGIRVDNISPMSGTLDTSGIRPETLIPGPLARYSTRDQREAQFPVWEHLAGCSLPVDRCTTCTTGYPSLVKVMFSDHDKMEAVLCLGSDAQSFVDAMDKALDKLPPWLQKKCLDVLREVCGRKTLLPNSIRLPICYNRSDNPLYRGRHSDVWTIEHQGRYVAVKELRIYSTSDSEKMISRFCGAVMTWKALRHPNVLPLLWVTMDNPRLATASEWMVNGNINEFIETNCNANRFDLLKDAAKGLIYIHSQELMHGDLRGVNILVDQSCRALLAGFEFLTITSGTANSAGTNAGATRWMSPELLYPEHFGFTDSQPTKQSDCYAFGMVILEVLSGGVPFGHLKDILVAGRVIEGERPTRPEGGWFVDDLWKFLEQCWTSKPGDRPTAETALGCLEQVSSTLQHLPSSTEVGVETDVGQIVPQSGIQSPVSSQSSILGASDQAEVPEDEEFPRFVNLEAGSPLGVSTAKWTRKSPADEEKNVEGKVRALLNKLTVEKFDPISDKIIAWANRSEAEKDGRTLTLVIKLVFERATDEAAWSEMYARLCKKMMEAISPNIRDENTRNAEGKPIAGGPLFRKYLLNRCQEDFERGWASDDPTVRKNARKSEAELCSDEYYDAQKAKRRGLGLMQFIGELYKVQMLTEGVIHDCIDYLLGDDEDPDPEEEEVESLSRLLTTAGKLLDKPKARTRMDSYFARMKGLSEGGLATFRIKSMLQDLIELRGREWAPRIQVAAPTTIAQIHEEEKAAPNRASTTSRGRPLRGGSRNKGSAGEQRADAGPVAGRYPPRPLPKPGAHSNSSWIKKPDPVVMGPSSIRTNKDAAEQCSTFPGDSSSEIFVMLGRDVEAMLKTGAKPSRPSGGTMGVNPGVGGTTGPQRKKLQLLPRSIPLETGNKANCSFPGPSKQEREADDIKGFFEVRDVSETEEYFRKLLPEHHHRLVENLVTKAIVSKEDYGRLAAAAFARAAEKKLCSNSALEKGFSRVAESLDYIANDAPKAFENMATMMKGAGLDKGREQRIRIAQKSANSVKLLGLLM